MTAPERIWACPGNNRGWYAAMCSNEPFMDGLDTEYVRADLAPTWRSIDSAPKDGTPHVRAILVRPLSGGHPWWEYICGRLDDEGEFRDHDDNAPFSAEDYDAWMPLPQPPEDTK